MVSHNPLSMVEIYIVAILYDRTLLIYGYEIKFTLFVLLDVWLAVSLLNRHFLWLLGKSFIDDWDIRVIVRVMRVKYIFLIIYIGLIHLSQDHVGGLLLLSLFLNNGLRSCNKIMDSVVNVGQ